MVSDGMGDGTGMPEWTFNRFWEAHMGLMDFIKGELIDIIEWTDDSRDTLSFRFPDTGQGNQARRPADCPRIPEGAVRSIR